MLVESYVGAGMSIYPEAITRVEQIMSGTLEGVEVNGDTPAPGHVPTPEENAAAMAQWTAMTAGLQHG